MGDTRLVTQAVTTLSEDIFHAGSLGKGVLLIAKGPYDFADGTRYVPIKPSGAVKLGDLRIQEDEDSPWQDFVPGVTTLPASEKFHKLGSIYDALKDNETILLRGTWIEQMGEMAAEGGTVLPRRQDLPEKASWEPMQCLRLVTRANVLIVAISYCWEAQNHPDPRGEQLKSLSRVIKLRLDEERLPLQDLAIFWDWCSLYQKERTPEQEDIFNRSLGAVNLWYAHMMVMCWLLTSVPEHVLKYEERGWPTFEHGVSSFIKDHNKVMDLGIMDQKQCKSWWDMLKLCTAHRSPPTAPEEFAKHLDTKLFTNGADSDFVKKKYEATFREVMESSVELDFKNLHWGDKEFRVLANALKACQKLNVLKLCGNQPGCQGCQALVEAFECCKDLMEIYLRECKLEDDDAVLIVEHAKKSQSINLIDLGDNYYLTSKAVVKIAKLCPGITTLTELYLDKANVKEEGAAAIVQMISKTHSLRELY